MKKPIKNLFLLLCLYGLLIAGCEKEASDKGVIREPADSSAVFSMVAGGMPWRSRFRALYMVRNVRS